MVHFQICLSKEKNTFPHRIRYYRQIYSNFGIIIDLFSSCFGWMIIAFLIQFTFDLINLSYWLYIDMTIVKVLPLCISKFSERFCLVNDKLHKLIIMFCFPLFQISLFILWKLYSLLDIFVCLSNYARIRQVKFELNLIFLCFFSDYSG